MKKVDNMGVYGMSDEQMDAIQKNADKPVGRKYSLENKCIICGSEVFDTCMCKNPNCASFKSLREQVDLLGGFKVPCTVALRKIVCNKEHQVVAINLRVGVDCIAVILDKPDERLSPVREYTNEAISKVIRELPEYSYSSTTEISRIGPYHNSVRKTTHWLKSNTKEEPIRDNNMKVYNKVEGAVSVEDRVDCNYRKVKDDQIIINCSNCNMQMLSDGTCIPKSIGK